MCRFCDVQSKTRTTVRYINRHTINVFLYAIRWKLFVFVYCNDSRSFLHSPQLFAPCPLKLLLDFWERKPNHCRKAMQRMVVGTLHPMNRKTISKSKQYQICAKLNNTVKTVRSLQIKCTEPCHDHFCKHIIYIITEVLHNFDENNMTHWRVFQFQKKGIIIA